METKKLTYLAFYTTLALILSYVESLLPPLVPIPGIKIGLANIVSLIILYQYTFRDAFLVMVVRVLLSALLFGQMISLLYSLSGGVLSLILMYLCLLFLQKHCLPLVSMAGGVSHNAGQILMAYCLTTSPAVFSYLPYLILSGLITGLFTGICVLFVSKRIPGSGL